MEKIKARFYHPGRIERVRILVPHCTQSEETPGSRLAVARWWAGPDSAVSSAHTVSDPTGTVQCVDWEDTAFAAPGANADGEHFEMCGRAEQDEAGWLDDASRATIDHAARVMAGRALARGIPVRYLTDEQVADGRTKGIARDHWQITRVFGLSTHTDMGRHFPHQLLIGRIQYYVDLLQRNPPTPTPAPLKVPAFPGVIRVGDRGKHVIRIKRRLAARGWSLDVASWVFGDHAAAVVTAFEREKGLHVESPGVVGPEVWRAAWTAPVTR